MFYQSSAELEKQLINKLSSQWYNYIKLEDSKALENNFRIQLNYINKTVLNSVDFFYKDIERIVSEYSERKEIEKFCHIATMEEIEENDYNLNIPRCVDTFKPEPEVDLQAVKESIKTHKTNIQRLEQEVQTYLDELGGG